MWARHLSEAELTQCADGELTGAALRRAEDHLRNCRACANALEQVRAAARLMLTLPQAEPPYDLREQIATRVAAQPLPELSCRQALALIHESLDRPLSPLSAGFLRLHLDTCPDCALEHSTLAETTRAVRSLRPVPAPMDLRQAAYARVSSVTPIGVKGLVASRLRLLAPAAVAAAALFLALRATPPQVPTSLPRDVSPPVVASVPQPSAQPEAVAPASVAPPAVVAQAPVETPRSAPASLAAPNPRSVRHHLPSRSALVVASLPAPSPEPTATESGPRALRALRAVATAASSDHTPHVSLASLGERLATLDSEAVASSFSDDSPLPEDEPPISPVPPRNHESGASSYESDSWSDTQTDATGGDNSYILARLLEGTSRPA